VQATRTLPSPPENPRKKSKAKVVKSQPYESQSVQIPCVPVKQVIGEIKQEEISADHEDEPLEVQKPKLGKRKQTGVEEKSARKKIKVNLPKFNCSKCHKTSVTQHHLSLHESGPVKCEECEKICKDIVQYRSHVSKHKSAQKMATCEICGLLIQTVKMKSHKDTHLPRKMSCDICGKAFLKGHHLRVT
jgi:transcription elongation factor Elf1